MKTTYYLRLLGASNIEKATVASKEEVRGVAGGEGIAPAETPKKVYTAEEKAACSIEANAELQTLNSKPQRTASAASFLSHRRS